jgi:amidohydrolase
MNVHSEIIKKDVASYYSELIALRRDLHMHPELGYQEFRTSGIIKEYLEDLGIKTQIVTKTGVVGLLKGASAGKTVMLRADIDALAQQEATDVSYKSKVDGKMHACGHDGHTAMLMIAAKILSKHKDEIQGNIKFVFQPNEEAAGAMNMINEGVLDNPKVDAAFGHHIWTPIESGKVAISGGPVMAADEEFELIVKGRPGHTSAPQEGRDPILVAATIVQALQSLQTREYSPLIPISIMVGQIHGGTTTNIIPGEVQMSGTIRYLFENEKVEKAKLLEKIERLVRGICESMGAECDLEFIPSNPSVMNDYSLVDFARNAADETLGEGHIIDFKCMAGDDFGDFSQYVPSLFYFIGTGNKEKKTDYPHHHPMFNIDEDTLSTGVEMHVRMALNYLGSKSI